MPWVRPEWMPKPFWRRVVLWRNIYLTCGVLSVLLLMRFFFFQSDPNKYYFLAIYFAVILFAAALFTVTPRILFRRLRDRLREHENSDCLECGYCLLGLAVDHKCPECGTSYRLDEVRAAWSHWITHLRLPDSFPARK